MFASKFELALCQAGHESTLLISFTIICDCALKSVKPKFGGKVLFRPPNTSKFYTDRLSLKAASTITYREGNKSYNIEKEELE